jgi:hypothetical protein
MSTIDTGEPAFPRDERYQGHNGMTLRDYFAIHALPIVAVGNQEQSKDWLEAKHFPSAAADAYALADAMLKARSE